LTVFHDDVDDIEETKTEENGDGTDVLEQKGDDDAEEDKGVQDLLFRTDVERKKERRQERALQDKEGERRRKEGLPQNFLLADKKTRKPYSMGVGD